MILRYVLLFGCYPRSFQCLHKQMCPQFTSEAVVPEDGLHDAAPKLLSHVWFTRTV